MVSTVQMGRKLEQEFKKPVANLLSFFLPLLLVRCQYSFFLPHHCKLRIIYLHTYQKDISSEDFFLKQLDVCITANVLIN